MFLPSAAPRYTGTGLATGLEHRLRYVARLSNNAGGQNGNSWIVTSFPYLHYSVDEEEGEPVKVILMGAGGAQWERVSAGTYQGLFGTKRQLLVSGTDFRVIDPAGNVRDFFGPATAPPLRGRLKAELGDLGPESISTAVSYDSHGRIASEVRTDPVTGDQAGLFYHFAEEGPHTGRILSVEKRVVRSGAQQLLKRWIFTYHDGSDSAGSLNDLRTVEEQVWQQGADLWASLGRRYFRYYTTHSAIGFIHGLRYVLEPDGYERMVALGLEPTEVSQVSDSVLAEFAAAYYEYDSDRRHSKAILRAGTETTTYARLNSSNETIVNWARREIATRPDGTMVTTYFNEGNRPVLKLLRNGTNLWADYWEFDEQNHEILHATPAAIASVTEPATDSQNFSVTLKSDEGLISIREYYPPSGGGSAAAPGYLRLRSVREGSEGDAIKQREHGYAGRVVAGAAIYKVAALTEFRSSADGGSDPATTSLSYQWREDSFAVEQLTVTPPVVSTQENGNGVATSRVSVFDVFGNPRWLLNERGRIDYQVHDRLTGALRFLIKDADTAQLENVPDGWITANGFGSHLRTDCVSDTHGRAILVEGPQHWVAAKNETGEVVPVLTRRAEFALYLDERREVRSARGASTAGGLRTLGTVELRRYDYANQIIETIQAARACPCGPLSAAEVFPQSSWRRWSRDIYNAAAYRDESRVWCCIPVSGEGVVEADFLATRYGRDALGRENRVIAPGGTLTRTVFDPRGRSLSLWMGTDDSGATDTDPTGGGAPGNNMVLITTNTYDGGTDGGNGNLTQRVRPVDDDSQHDREELFDYDFRDRLVGESYGDGTHTYHTRLERDNRGEVTRTELYHTSIDAANLVSRADSHFDALRRDYKEAVFAVDPETGAVGHALVRQRWRDASDNVIKETQPGSEGFVKRVFDAFERSIRAYTACNPSGGSSDGDPAADTVVEQSADAYDAAGNLLFRTQWQRFHDATGTGPLHGPDGSQPKGRRTFLAWWHDAIGREVAAADYGTYGGAELVRPAVPPLSSAKVLVTRTVHADAGEAAARIAPDGIQTRWKRDALGREIEQIENFQESAAPAADVNRTTRLKYHPSGSLATLTLVNPVTGDQVTRWIYGTTLADSAVATGHLLRAKIYPESDDRDAPLGDGPDGVYERIEHTYNRQGEIVATKDPNETVHEYLRDKMGRLRHDRIVAFGTGVDETIRRISTSYDSKRPTLVAQITSHDDAEPGQGSVLNEVARKYDAFRQQTQDAQAHDGPADGSTPKVAYAYADGASGNSARRQTMTYPNGRQVNLGYGAADSIEDLFSLVKTVGIEGEGERIAYTRAGLGRFVEITYPQPDVRMSMLRPGGGNEGDSGDPYDGFDRFSRTQEMRWEKITGGELRDCWQWGFNRLSNRTWRKNLGAGEGQDEAYGYDGLQQVIRNALGTLNTNHTLIGGIPAQAEDFEYDSTGNWLGYRKDADGTIVLDQTRANNKDNQLTQIDGSSALIAYDKAGNALKLPPGLNGDWSKDFQLVWDAWNRLVEVRDENGNPVQKNQYDGLTRRITKESGGVVTHCYYNDRWKAVEERLDSATTAARSYLWGERPDHRDELAFRDRDTNGNGTLDERLYATMDYFNGTAILDDAGAVVERYGYSAFGVRRVMAPNFGTRAHSDYAWEFGFQGQFLDTETGWTNYGYRFYVPALGRWPSRDPIEEKGGINLYEMADNDPLDRIDYLGQVSMWPTFAPPGSGPHDRTDPASNPLAGGPPSCAGECCKKSDCLTCCLAVVAVCVTACGYIPKAGVHGFLAGVACRMACALIGLNCANSCEECEEDN